MDRYMVSSSRPSWDMQRSRGTMSSVTASSPTMKPRADIATSVRSSSLISCQSTASREKSTSAGSQKSFLDFVHSFQGTDS
jgi:hypothetical protein